MSHPDLCPFKNISPQICILWRHTQIYVLQNICSLRSVSSDVIHRSVSSTFWTERKNTCIAINSRIHIWDTHWLVPIWYQLISCIIYPFMLCVVCFFCNLWFYCSMHDSVHKTKNRPLDLFFTDCINPNSVTIRPSLKKIKYIPLTFHYLFELLERLRSSDCHKWPPIYGGLSCDFLL